MKHTIVLEDDQVDVVLSALRFDAVSNQRTFGALPVGAEEHERLKSAYDAVAAQTGR